MKRLFLFVSILTTVAIGIACSGEASNSNNNSGTAVVAASDYTDANAALADGIKLLDQGDTEKAIEVLTRATELDPNLADAYFRLGVAYSLIEFRDQLEAQQDAEPTPTLAPGEKKPKEKKTNSEIAFEKAVAGYKKLIDTNDQDHAAYYNLGRAYNKLNEDEEAAKALRQAVKLNPEDSEYQTELGSILIKLAKYPEAVGTLKKAVELDPQNLEAEELLEKAEAGRKRITFTQLPDDKKSGNSNSNSAASNTAEQSNTATKPPEKNPSPKPATPAPKPKP